MPRVSAVGQLGVKRTPDQKEVWGPLPICGQQRAETQLVCATRNPPRAQESMFQPGIERAPALKDHARSLGTSLAIPREASLLHGPLSDMEYPEAAPRSIMPRALDFGSSGEGVRTTYFSLPAPDFTATQLAVWQGQCVRVEEGQLRQLLAQSAGQEEGLRPALRRELQDRVSGGHRPCTGGRNAEGKSGRPCSNVV